MFKIETVVRFCLILNILLAFSLIEVFAQDRILSGLNFSSAEVIQDNRTSLNLTPNESYRFSEGISLEFDANFRSGDGHYGYIFRLIGDGDTNIDLVSNFVASTNFWLVIKDQILCSYRWSDFPDLDFGRWVKIKVDIDIKNTKIAISFNGINQEVDVPDLAKLKQYDLVFGASKYSPFQSRDVCPMSLRNVRIYNHENKLFRDWQLSRHGQDKVYDEIANAEAVVDNPIWNIDKHVRWRTLKNLKIENLLGIAKDLDRGKLFFVDNKAIYTLSVESLIVDTTLFAEGAPFNLKLGKQIIYNKFTDEIWSYSFNNNTISIFNFKTKSWSVNEPEVEDPGFAHHNKLISPLDSSLVTMFGYGFFTYKSIVNHYDLKTERWEKIDRSDQIEPRYLSGSGFMNDEEMLVFGGYGSKTGRQELSSEFYYDLYSFNLNDYSFEKIWTLTPPVIPFVPSEDLIFNEQSNSFYALVYNSVQYETFLRLARFGVEDAEYQFYNDSIPYNFLDTESWNTLFLNEQTSELIALTSHKADISINAIAYPPLMPEVVYQNELVKNKFGSYWWIVLILTSLFGAGAYFIFRKRRIKSVKSLNYSLDQFGIEAIPVAERSTKPSILLLGGFQIYDHDGNDITADFSPTLKQLFLFIFLHTSRNGKGVSSAKLDEILWFDKSEKSARNNRNVNISKLRSVFDKVGGVEVVNKNSFWKIELQEFVYCDFVEVLDLMKDIKMLDLPESKIYKLLGLLLNGEFLPNVQTDWSDPFKATFASEVIDSLTWLVYNEKVKGNISLQYYLADCLFTYDPVSEDALMIKCTLLYQLGKRSSAKHTYDSFCKDYKHMLGVDFSVPFKDIFAK